MQNLFVLLSLLTLVSLSCSYKKKAIYLIRNGITSFNTESMHRVSGRINIPLTVYMLLIVKPLEAFYQIKILIKYIIVQFQWLNILQKILPNNIKLKPKWENSLHLLIFHLVLMKEKFIKKIF